MNKKRAASLLGAGIVFLAGAFAWPGVGLAEEIESSIMRGGLLYDKWYTVIGERAPGETHERTFDTPGVYPYVCEPHETDYDMKGVVRVVP
jgi:plastocyanin